MSKSGLNAIIIHNAAANCENYSPVLGVGSVETRTLLSQPQSMQLQSNSQTEVAITYEKICRGYFRSSLM
jgi:hypothetical protein